MKSNYFYSQPNYPHLRTAIEAEINFQALYVLSTTLEHEFDEMSNSLLHRPTSIRVGTEKKTPLKKSSGGKARRVWPMIALLLMKKLRRKSLDFLNRQSRCLSDIVCR